jgi:Ca-activated chloride channel homolog
MLSCKNLRVFCVPTLLAAGVDSSVSAQVPTFSATSNLVVLSATAVDGKGRPVTDLRREELKIFEEGRPQRIEHFTEAKDLQARVLLLVDVSGSMNEELKTASSKMAAVQLMAALAPQDLVALAGFDSRYFGLVPFTRDRQEILHGLDSAEPFGSTALHDALDQAAKDLASHGEGRRAVVVITDGVDTASQQTPEAVIARSRALDVPIYTLSVVSPLDDPDSSDYVGQHQTSAAAAGSAQLARYAQLSGGASFRVSDFRGLKRAAERISEELKHQYRLGYDAPSGPSRFRRVEIRSTRRGVVVRTRSGYISPS